MSWSLRILLAHWGLFMASHALHGFTNDDEPPTQPAGGKPPAPLVAFTRGFPRPTPAVTRPGPHLLPDGELPGITRLAGGRFIGHQVPMGEETEGVYPRTGGCDVMGIPMCGP